MNKLIYGLIILIGLSSCSSEEVKTEKLTDITSRIEKTAGFVDLTLTITNTADTDSSYVYIAQGLYNSDTVGIEVSLKKNVKAGIVDGEMRNIFLNNGITLKSIGSKSDKLLQAMTELYIACINTNDTELNDKDEVALYIDDNMDRTYPEPGDNSEGNYWATYHPNGNEIRYRPIYNTGSVGEVVQIENPQLEFSDATGVVVSEFMLPIGDDADWKITPNENNQSGLFLFVRSGSALAEKDGYWPAQNLQVFDPLGYGTISFGATDLMPVPPLNGAIWWDRVDAPITVLLSWDYPDMNDFDHFNVYIHRDGNSELLAETIGSQLVYITDNSDYATFTITTVDYAQNESEESEPLIFDIMTGISQPDLEMEMKVYPNPSSGQVTVAFATSATNRCNIEVLAPNGTLLDVVFDGVMEAGKHQVSWQPQQISAGIYFMRIRTGESTITRKILVMP